jgi:hypothetical protein|tara:strand:+ start:171 stop:344 length:174 start_codon:yes stop_codon:yes gene_type:complete
MCDENYKYWCKMGEMQVILVADEDPSHHYDLAASVSRRQAAFAPRLSGPLWTQARLE